MKALRNLTIVSTIVLFILAFASNAGADLIVNEISGTFHAIGLDSGDSAYFELTQGEITQPAAGGTLVVLDIGVDLTGYTESGNRVLVDGSTVAIWNQTNGTFAAFNVDSASLIQWQISPLGIGQMSLDLTLDLTQNTNPLTTDAGDLIVLPSTMQMFIIYMGLAIETDGGDGIANLNGHERALFSAVPEPATLALLLGGLAFVRKRRNQVSIR